MNHRVEIPTITSSSPVEKLNRDILWLIFSQNADMFEPLPEYLSDWDQDFSEDSALETTLSSSRVCRSWRDFLLGTPSIWGRVLRFEKLRRLGREGWTEVLKRTGNAPLDIMGNATATVNAAERAFRTEFFGALLRRNWARVKRMHVRIEEEEEGEDQESFAVAFSTLLLLPAPSLESADLYFTNPTSTGTSRPFPEDTILFSNDAPSLREFRIHLHQHNSSFININIGGDWFISLQILKLDMPQIESLSVFKAIKGMQLLQHLSLHDLSGTLNPFGFDAQSTDLPHLLYLELGINFNTDLTFARVIKPASDCALSWCAVITQIPLSKELGLLLSAELLRYFGMYFGHWSPSSLVATIEVQLFSIKVVQADALSSATPFVSSHALKLSLTSSSFDYWDIVTLIDPLLKCDLSSVKELDISLGPLAEDAPWEKITLLLTSLSNVETLRTTSVGLRCFAHCMKQPQANSLRVRVVFPKSRVLRLYSSTPHEIFIANFWKYYSEKRDHGASIEVLDLGEPAYDWRFLELASGLRVLWGDPDDVRSEYICGSGDSGRLNFGYDYDDMF